jgi:21S rRNA (uridine2791-2'-O)-methyltransferase
LKVGGHFVCKFYQGSEDKAFEMRLKTLFKFVHREKPESSRSVGHALAKDKTVTDSLQESKEAYFVAIRRKPDEKGSVDGRESVQDVPHEPPLD